MSPSPHILLTLTNRMLPVRTDQSHLFNISIEMFLYLIQNSLSPFDVQPKLKLTYSWQQRYPKLYATWFHFKWFITYLLSHTNTSNKVPFPTQQHQKEHMTSGKLILQTNCDLYVESLLIKSNILLPTVSNLWQKLLFPSLFLQAPNTNRCCILLTPKIHFVLWNKGQLPDLIFNWFMLQGDWLLHWLQNKAGKLFWIEPK